MGLHALDGNVVPADALDAGDDTDGFLLCFEDRALLDMGLEMGAQPVAARLLVAEIADTGQFLAHGLAVDVLLAVAVGQVEGAGKDARADHGRGETGTLLVGPADHLHGRLRRDAGLVERAHDLEAREHAVDAVELATGRLGVEMAAGGDRQGVGIAAGAAREDVAHLVDRAGHAGIPAPGDEEIAPGLVAVRERQAAVATLLGGVDLRHLHDGLPQAVGVDLQSLAHRCPRRAGGSLLTPAAQRSQKRSFASCPLASSRLSASRSLPRT